SHCALSNCVKTIVVGDFLNYACIAALALVSALQHAAKGEDDADDSPYRPGLIGTYVVGDQAATRPDEVIAFDWQNAACDPRLPPGEFTVAWAGRLWARGAGHYTLAC